MVSSEDCMNCSDPCCRFYKHCADYAPVFTKEEMDAVIKQGKERKLFKNIGNNQWQLKLKDTEGDYYICPFVKDKIYCGIYNYRPFDCQLWPFVLIKSKDNKKVFLAVELGENCHALDRHWGTQKMEKHIKSLSNELSKKNFRELAQPYKDDFKIICEIKG